MKYIRTKDGIIDIAKHFETMTNKTQNTFTPIKTADTIEELIQPNDIVFYWQQSDDKEHCALMIYNEEIEIMKHSVTITKILIPVRDDYKCVAKAEPSFELIKGRRYLIQKGELELI